MKRALGYLHLVYLRVQSTHIRWTFVVPAVAVVLVVGSIGLFPEQVQATSFDLDKIFGFFVSVMARFLFAVATLIIKVIVWALKLFVVLAGYNGYSTAPIVELGWTLVRDVANMMFIVAMLVIAFATILGREDYALKKTLGKLILMAILINFSKLIAQLIIDVAHVVTMTFLNALSAVAGGNLIQMFKFNDMRRILTPTGNDAPFLESINLQLLGAAILTLIMTSVALAMIGVYFIIMLYRVVTLWALIIFSPIAYAAAALPATASVSRDWWSQFIKNVVSAPMMVFFMWLAFATIGNGSVLSQITDNNSLPNTETANFTEESASIGGTGSQEALSVSAATTWENMAGFAIAVAFLFAGIERVQALGVDGANKLSGAKNLGTKFALGASGVLAGAWVAKKGAKAVVEKAPLVGTDAWKRRGQNISNRFKRRSAKSAEWWDTKIANSKLIGDKGSLRWVGNKIKSRRFKAKVASDWQKAAESAEQIYDTAISTGKTTPGKLKLNLGEKAAMSRERDEIAGANKRAEERAKILAEEAEKTQSVRDRATQQMEAIDERTDLTEEQKQEQKELIQQERDAAIDKIPTRYLDYETEKVNKAGTARERQIEAKGRVLEHGRLDSKYAVQYEQELYEEQEKEFVNLRPSEFLGKAKVYAEQIRTTQDPTEKKKLREKARALLIAAQKKGSFEAGEVLKGFAQAIGSEATGLNTGETEGMQQFMSRALGYGQDNFEDMRKDMSIAEQRQFQVSAESMAMDGDTRTVSLFKKVYDPTLQRERLAVNTDYNVADEDDETIGRAEYVNLSKVTSSDAMVSVEYTDNGKKQVAKISNAKDISRLIGAYKSMKQNTRLTSSNKSSLQALMKRSKDAKDGQWEKFMQNLKVESTQAFEALQKEIEGVQSAPSSGNTPPVTPPPPNIPQLPDIQGNNPYNN